MTAVFNVPFDAGIRQDVNPAVAPEGFVARIENGRIPRAGEIVKAHGATTVDPTESDTSWPFGTGLPHGAAETLSRQTLALSGRAYARDWNTAPTWQEVGRVARYMPIKQHWLALNATTTVDTPPHIAAMSGAVCVVYTLGSGGVQILLYDEAITCRFSQFVAGRRNPRVITVGTEFVVTYEDSDASPTLVYLRVLDPATLSLGGESSFITRQTANDRYDAAAYSDTEIVWVARTGATTWTVQRLQISPLSVIATRNITVANSVHAYERVYANGTDGIYAAFYVAGAGTGTVAACNNALSADATAAYGTNAAQHPSFTRRNATSVWMTWVDLLTEDRVQVAQVSNTAVVTAATSSLFSIVLASTPFAGADNHVSFWIHSRTNTTGGAPFADRYTLVTAQLTDTSGGSYFLCPELTSDGRASLSHGAPTNGLKSFGPVAAIDNRHFAAILSDIGIHTSALALEYEDLTTLPGATRGIHSIANAGAISGGHLQEMTFSRVNPNLANVPGDPRGFENGFIRDPAQLNLVDLGAGGMSAGVYQVQVVYAYIDTAGRIHRSAPSASQSVTIAANRTIRVVALAAIPSERDFSAQSQATKIEVYMTAANGATFYNRGGQTIAALSATAQINIDFSTDTDTSSEILYTAGNRFPNRPAPSSRSAVVSHDAMWLVGLWDQRMIERSKTTAVNQPVRFTRADQFRALAPIEVDAIAELDDQILLLGKRGLCVMSATGPSDQGNPFLISPTLLSSTGCLAPNSVIRIPQGVVYFGERGFYLVPRGGGEPEFIGAPVQSEISFVNSAAPSFDVNSSNAPRSSRSRSVAFACETSSGGTVTAVLDLDSLQWSSFDSITGALLGYWSSGVAFSGGGLVYLPESFHATNSPIRRTSGYANGAAFLQTLIETGWLRPFDLLGWGYVRRVILLCTVKAAPGTLRIAMESARDGGGYTTLGEHETTTTGLQAIEWQLPGDQPCNSVRFRMHDVDDAPGEGVVWHGLSLDVDPVEGIARLIPARRV